MSVETIQPINTRGSSLGPAGGRHRWVALALLAMAQFVVVLDGSVVNIALPSIGGAMGLDTASLTWVITAYVLPFGALLLLGGRLGDSFGRRRVFLLGVLGFLLASVGAGLAPTFGWLVAARAVQGVAAALMSPTALALVTTTFADPRERTRALGVWGAVAGAGGAAGVVLGGVLTTTLGWPWVFFVNLPVAVVVLAGLPLTLPRDRSGRRASLDLPGAATVTAGLVALVWALTAVGREGWASPLVWGPAAAAVVLLVAFVAVERRAAHPLVPLGVFSSRAVTVGNLAMMLVGAAVLGVFFVLSVFLQQVLGYSALRTGVAQLPLALAIVLAASLTSPLAARFGNRSVLTTALVTMAAGLGWLALAPVQTTFAVDLLGPTLLVGTGLGAAFVTLTAAVLSDTSASTAGLVSGLVSTAQQIGGVVGLALLGTLVAIRSDQLTASGTAAGTALAAGTAWAFAGAAALTVAAAVLVGTSLRTSRA